MDAIKTAKVWIGERKGITSPIHVSQYDTAWTFQFKVYKDDLIYEPENAVSVIFTGKKSDDTVFAVPADFEDGVATVVSTVAMTSAAGIVECELRFSEGGETVGSANFDMVVEPSPVEGGTPSEDDFTTLQTMLDDMSEMYAETVDNAAAAEAAVDTAAAELVAEVPDLVWDWLEDNVSPETGYVLDSSLTVQGAAADAKAAGDKIGTLIPQNRFSGTMTTGAVNRTTGADQASSSLQRTGFLNIEGISALIYKRIYTTSSSATWGLAFYTSTSASSFITGEGPVLNAAVYHTELSRIDVPETAKYVRFTWRSDQGSFEYYDAAQYENAGITRHEQAITVLQQTDAETGKKLDGATKDITASFTFVDEKRIRSVNGAYQGGSSYASYKANQNFVNIEGYTHLRITMVRGTSASESGLAFYSTASESNFVSGVPNGVAATASGTEVLLTIPADAKYVRTTYWADSALPLDAPSFSAVAEYIGVNDRLDTLESDVKDLNTDIFNMRSQERATVISDMQSGHGFTNPLGSGSEPQDDTADYLFGSQSVKFQYAGQALVSSEGLDLRNKIITVTFKADTITTGDEIRMYLAGSSSMASYRSYVLYEKAASDHFEQGTWGTVTVSTNGGRVVGDVDLSKIKYIRFTGSSSSMVFHVQSVGYHDRGAQRPCISFTFDDGWSEVMAGAKILGKYNISGTAYIFAGCQLSLAQLKALKQDYGWDIEMHGANTFTSMTEEAVVAELTSLQTYIRENGLGKGNHIAYPGGQNSQAVVNIMRRFCDSARTINRSSSNVETIPSPMPYNLRAVSSIGASGTTVAMVKQYIDQVVARKGWLILVFHRIGDTATTMFCSESDLEDIAQYAIASGADIKTVADMWERN